MDDFFAPAPPQNTENYAPPVLPFANDETDPTADFLAREQAALGDDHAFVTRSFGEPNPNVETTPYKQPSVADGGFGTDDFENVEHQSLPNSKQEGFDIDSFQTDFPPAESVGQPSLASNSSLHQSPVEVESESEAVREWRTKHAQAIAERDAKSEQKHREQIEAAKQAIDRFYEEYNEKKQKMFAKNRENENQQAAENAAGTVWEKVAREVDAAAAAQPKTVKGASRDRMRQVLSELRKDPNSPGNV